MISRLRPYLRPAPVGLALFALVLVLPGLGRFGLWEPEELRLAEAAAQASAAGELWAATAGTGAPGRALWPALGMAAAGVHESAARLPGALLALAAVAALAWAGAGLYGRRAGLIAGAVLAASPLFVLQARQLTSDAPLLLGHALMLGALARLASGRRPPVGPLVLGGLGVGLSVLAAGVLIGTLVPVAAGLGAALLASAGLERTTAIQPAADRAGDRHGGVGRRHHVALVHRGGAVLVAGRRTHRRVAHPQLRGAAAQPGLRAVPVHRSGACWRCCNRWGGWASDRGVRFADGLVSLLAAFGLALGAIAVASGG